MNLTTRIRAVLMLFLTFFSYSFNATAQYIVPTIEPESTIGSYLNVTTVNADLAVLPNGNTLRAIVWDSYNAMDTFHTYM